MSDVSFTFGMDDRVTPVIQRQKAEAAGLQKQLKEAGGALAKAGGPAGGIAGRVLGGAGGPFAMLAAGAILATTAISVMNAQSQKAVDLAKDRVSWEQKLTAAIKSGTEARSGTAAGGLSQAADMRLLLTRGGSLDRAKADVGRGVTLQNAIQGESALTLAPAARQKLIREGAKALAETGEITFSEAVKRLSDRRGALRLDRELIDIRGQMPTTANIYHANDSLSRRDDFKYHDTLKAIDDATSAGDLVPSAQNADLTSGRTATAVASAAADILDPIGKAVGSLAEEVKRGAELMSAAAKAQDKVVAALAHLGEKFGGAGSEADKANNYKRGSSVVNN